MADEQIGQRRTEQDVIVNSANDAFTADVIGWRTDVPGGRVILVEISEEVLYNTALDLITPIIAMRLHRVKRVTDANLANEARDHAAAIATHFARCCYQHMRESAKMRYSPHVRTLMNLDLQITRGTLPSVLSRMVAGFGPLFISEGHLKHTILIPYMRPGLGDLQHAQNDQARPWITDPVTLLTAITALRVPPEIRVTDVDFTGTEGSAFWTIWNGSPDDATHSTGFCTLPEALYTVTDKLLAAITRLPLFTWPATPLVPVDWSDTEADLPQDWAGSRSGTYRFGVEVTLEGLRFRGSRHFYFPAELLCAQVVLRPDHTLVKLQAGSSSAAPPSGDDDTQMAVYDTSAKRPRTEEAPTETYTSILSPTQTLYAKIGYAGFYGEAYSGVTTDVSTQLFYKASGLV